MSIRAVGRRVLLVAFTLLVVAVHTVDAQLPQRQKPRPRGSEPKAKAWNPLHEEGVRWIGLLVVLTFLPPIVSFFYNVYRDPATPTVIKNGWEIIRERTMGTLSKQKKAT